MKWMLPLLVFLSSACFARGAIVGGELEQDFKARAIRMIARAQANGWSRVGPYSLAYLLARVNEPEVVQLPPNVTSQYGSRETAEFNCLSSVVHLNAKAWNSIKNYWYADGLALHELLSASKACLDDSQFQLTVRIDMMGANAYSKVNVLEDFYDGSGVLKNRIEYKEGSSVQIASGRGGTSGVGGGGDGMDYAIKRQIVLNFINAFPEFKARNGFKALSPLRLYQGVFDMQVNVYKYDHINDPVRVERAYFNMTTGEEIMRIGLGLAHASEAIDPKGPAFSLLLKALETNSLKYREKGCAVEQAYKDLFAKESPARRQLNSLLTCFK